MVKFTLNNYHINMDKKGVTNYPIVVYLNLEKLYKNYPSSVFCGIHEQNNKDNTELDLPSETNRVAVNLIIDFINNGTIPQFDESNMNILWDFMKLADFLCLNNVPYYKLMYSCYNQLYMVKHGTHDYHNTIKYFTSYEVALKYYVNVFLNILKSLEQKYCYNIDNDKKHVWTNKIKNKKGFTYISDYINNSYEKLEVELSPLKLTVKIFTGRNSKSGNVINNSIISLSETTIDKIFDNC